MSNLYIPDLSTDDFGPFVQGLADNFGALEGSLAEYGENENGRYWRWENGLQVCYRFVGDYWFAEEHGDHLEPNSIIMVKGFSKPATPSHQRDEIHVASGGLYTQGGTSVPSLIYSPSHWIATSWSEIIAINLSTSRVARIIGLRLLSIGRWK